VCTGRGRAGWITGPDMVRPTAIRNHCLRRVHPGSRKTLEVLLAHRLHFSWSGSNAAKLRADAPGTGARQLLGVQIRSPWRTGLLLIELHEQFASLVAR
jgi:hypothetical protein